MLVFSDGQALLELGLVLVLVAGLFAWRILHTLLVHRTAERRLREHLAMRYARARADVLRG